MTEAATRLYGCQSMTAPLRRVLVRRPGGLERWREYGWRGEPDAKGIASEHEAFCAALEAIGAEVIVGEPAINNPDAVYVYDPALITNDGAVLLQPGKAGRRSEPALMEADLARAGVPILARLTGPELAEGGDTLWLDEDTLLVGRGYRTNPAGIDMLNAALLGDVEVIMFDLPYLRGPGEVLHLMSLLSPLDGDLAVAYLPLMPVRLVELLKHSGVQLIEVPDEEFETMGPNVLALAPRVALALEGNDETRRRMERAGVDVRVYRGDELSRKGDGGPTCLTRPLLRA
jgi:dimethylargininase